MKRRDVLSWLLRAACTVLWGMVLYPVIRFLVPPRIPEPPTRRVTAAEEGELALDAFKIFPFGGAPGILIRMANGEYRALSAVCTHLACTVQYRRDRKDIWCACHNGIYNLEGLVVSGPPPLPLERYAVNVVGKDVIVEKSPS